MKPLNLDHLMKYGGVTRDNRKVKIYAVDAGGDYPIHGCIALDHNPASWSSSGCYSCRTNQPSYYDLFNLPNEEKEADAVKTENTQSETFCWKTAMILVGQGQAIQMKDLGGWFDIELSDAEGVIFQKNKLYRRPPQKAVEQTRKVWVNVYENLNQFPSSYDIYGSKYGADDHAKHVSEKRIACVEIELKYKDGDGL